MLGKQDEIIYCIKETGRDGLGYLCIETLSMSYSFMGGVLLYLLWQIFIGPVYHVGCGECQIAECQVAGCFHNRKLPAVLLC